MACLTDDQAKTPSDGIEVCYLDIDTHLKPIQANLPRGRAWPRDPEATLTKYWRAFAETIKYVEDRICDFSKELFCDTANETLPIWSEQYGLGAPEALDFTSPCLKPGFTEKLGEKAPVSVAEAVTSDPP